MGQCVALDRSSRLGTQSHDESGGELLPALPLREAGAAKILSETVDKALKGFREIAATGIVASGLQGDDEVLSAACDLVEAIILGVHQHLPAAIASIELFPASGESTSESTTAPLLVRIAVRFVAGPLVGEFATRSRQPVELQLRKHVSFALRRPVSDDYESEPLVLEARGVELRALPELSALRARLPQELASMPDGWHPRSTGAWWLQRRELECPIADSKLRRLCDSFSEVASLPAYFQGLAFWGYLHVCSRHLEAFDFYREGSAVTVTAQTRLVDPTEEPIQDVGTQLCHEMMRTHRPLAEHFAASTVNMGAMFEGRAIGQKGANPAKISKLFSAAKVWGPGEESWHRLDDTWLCVDKKTRWGQVTEEQGRVLWHAPGARRAGAELAVRLAVLAPTQNSVGAGFESRVAAETAAAASPAKPRAAKTAGTCPGAVFVLLGLALALPRVLLVAASAADNLGL